MVNLAHQLWKISYHPNFLCVVKDLQEKGWLGGGCTKASLELVLIVVAVAVDVVAAVDGLGWVALLQCSPHSTLPTTLFSVNCKKRFRYGISEQHCVMNWTQYGY